MKNKLLLIIVVIIGVILISVGSITIFSKQSSQDDDKKEPKELRKISEEEISNDTAKEIIQFYVNKDSSNKKTKISNVNILANDENGEYLVKLDVEDEKVRTIRTTIQYAGDGKWQVELPLKENNKDIDEYTEFWAEEDE